MAGPSGLASFPLGQTYFNGTTPATSTDYGTTQSLEGTERTFENRNVTDPITVRTGGNIECVLVRNVATIALLPSQAVTWKSGQEGKQVDGLVKLDAAEIAGIVDDRLPAAGVPVGDLFWLMRKGQVLALTSREADAQSSIAARAFLVARTAAASTSTTAGRLQLSLVSRATSANLGSVYEDNIRNSVGRAVSARASTQTSTTMLIDLDLKN